MHSTDLNLLAALDALLDEGSVVGAAARLGLTPSAMSRALGRIREQTGDPILVRAGRALVPTPKAIAIRERVASTVAEAQFLLSPDPAVEPSAFHRKFTLRADDSVAAVVGPQLLERLRNDAPGVTVVFCPEGNEAVSALRDGTIDLDIGVQGRLAPEVRTRKLIDDERVVLRRGSAGGGARRMGLRSYARAEHIDVSRRGLVRGPVDALLSEHGFTRCVRAVVPNQLAAAVLVAQTDAVSLVSARFARAIRGVLDVHAVPPPVSLERVSIALAWHPRHDGDPAHAWLRDQLRQIAGALRKLQKI